MPVMLDYMIHPDTTSLYNRPPCFGFYICAQRCEDLLEQGGRVEIEEKTGIVYDAVDENDGFNVCPVEKSERLMMNISFTLQKSELQKRFIEAAKEDMVHLKGYGLVTGCMLRCIMLCRGLHE